MGRYSLVLQNPFLILKASGRRVTLLSYGVLEELEEDPFWILKRLLARFAHSGFPGLPPFLGGAVGYAGYEAKGLIEPGLPNRPKPSMGLPDLCFLFFDEGVVFDHECRKTYVFAPFRKINALEQRLNQFSEKDSKPSKEMARENHFPPICTSLGRKEFVRKVKKIKAYIRKGDIFQANLSQRLEFPMDLSAAEVYGKLRKGNPSSFFGLFETPDFQIVSGSPERLLKLENGVLETRPIAGTRPRGRTPAEDLKLSRELVLNEKERAEHVMLVDLERNDLGRVAGYGSVSVDELMAIEDYSHVKHIVSNVKAELREGLGAVDAFRAFFPGGTITGTPKVRCMEILDELEPVGRGPYTGSLGYFSFSGNMDFNIIIRSLVLKDNNAYLGVGAGIVADSIAEKEYDETLYKAEGVLAALFGADAAGRYLARCGVASRVF